MNFKNFKNIIDSQILSRWRDIFRCGSLWEFHSSWDGHYSATIYGQTDDYYVSCRVDQKWKITRFWCDCPYNWGPYCKHQAAFLLYLEENVSQKIEPKDTSNTKKYSKLWKRNIQAYINKAVRSASSYGYVPWNRAHEVLDGVYEVLGHVDESIKKWDLVSAVNFLSWGIQGMILALDDIDDSSWEYSGVISCECIETYIPKILSHASKQESEKLSNIFALLIQDTSIAGWSFEEEILIALTPYIKNIDLAQELKEFFDSKSSQDMFGIYHGLMIYKLFQSVGVWDELLQKLQQEYQEDVELQIYLAEEYICYKDYSKAEEILLCLLDTMQHDLRRKKIFEMLLDIASSLQDTAKIQKYRKEILLLEPTLRNYKAYKVFMQQDFDKISLLDDIYAQASWQYAEIYLKICKFEKEDERIYQFIKRYPYTSYAAVVIDILNEYDPNFLCQLYFEEIERELEYTGGRKSYRDCTYKLRKLFDIREDETVDFLRSCIMKYSNRRAMREEFEEEFGELF